jgi:hypothetical protein
MSREIEQNPIKEQIPFDNSEREKIPSDKTPVIQTEKVLNFLPLTITHLTFLLLMK